MMMWRIVVCGIQTSQQACVHHAQVSTPGLQAAHHYIWGLTQQLQAAGEARGDVIVQTAFEDYTGSNDFDFVVRVQCCVAGWQQQLGNGRWQLQPIHSVGRVGRVGQGRLLLQAWL